jgi:hypothetical protein
MRKRHSKKTQSTLQNPATDLKAIDEKSANFILVDDYAVWFANR